MKIETIFWNAWHASRALSHKRYDRMIYCKNQMLKEIPDLLEKYFNGSNKALWFWIGDQID
jgi:hypothetical protein